MRTELTRIVRLAQHRAIVADEDAGGSEESLSGLSNDELQTELDRVVSRVDEISGLAASEVTDEMLAEMQTLAETAEAIRAEQADRANAEEERAARVAELAAQARGDDETDEAEEAEAAEEPAAEADPDSDDEDEPVEEPVAEESEERVPVAASVKPRTIRRRATSPANVTASRGPKMKILAEGVGVPLGAEIDASHLPKLLADKWAASQSATGEMKVARFATNLDAPELGGLPANEVARIIRERQSPEALVAAGGLCAPRTPLYDLPSFATAARPVRDALPGYNAARGGVTFMRPPSLGSITTGVGRITAAADALGGTNSAKSCQTIACPASTTVDVAAIYHCLQFGNMGARAFPEQVANALDLVMAAQSRLAEVALLDAISAACTKATGAQIGGVHSTLLPQILQAAVALRSRERMDPDSGPMIRVILPWWLKAELTADAVRSAYGVEGDRAFDSVLAQHRIRPIWTLDGATGAQQIWGAQTNAAPLNSFPATVKWYAFAEGTFSFLDGGELDIGIVRDSALNAQNNFQIFGETFENLFFTGIEALEVTTTVCPSGAFAAPSTATC